MKRKCKIKGNFSRILAFILLFSLFFPSMLPVFAQEGDISTENSPPSVSTMQEDYDLHELAPDSKEEILNEDSIDNQVTDMDEKENIPRDEANGMIYYPAGPDYLPHNVYLDLPGNGGYGRGEKAGFGTEIDLKVYPYRLEGETNKVSQLFSFYLVLPKGFSFNASDEELQNKYIKDFIEESKKPEINIENFTSLTINHLTTESGQEAILFVPNEGANSLNSPANNHYYATLTIPVRIMVQPDDYNPAARYEIFFNNNRRGSRENVGAIYISKGAGPADSSSVYPTFPIEDTGIAGAPDQFVSSIAAHPDYGRLLVLTPVKITETYQLYDANDQGGTNLLASIQVSGESGTEYSRSVEGIDNKGKWLDSWKADHSLQEMYDFSTLVMEEGEGNINDKWIHTPINFGENPIGKTYKVYVSKKEVKVNYQLFDIVNKDLPIATRDITGGMGDLYVPSEYGLTEEKNWLWMPDSSASLYDLTTFLKEDGTPFPIGEKQEFQEETIKLYVRKKNGQIHIKVIFDEVFENDLSDKRLKIYQGDEQVKVDVDGTNIENMSPSTADNLMYTYDVDLSYGTYNVKFDPPAGYDMIFSENNPDGKTTLDENNKNSEILIYLTKKPIPVAPILIHTQDTKGNTMSQVEITIKDLTTNQEITEEDGNKYQTNAEGDFLFEGQVGHQYEVTGTPQIGYISPDPREITGTVDNQHLILSYEKEVPVMNYIPKTGSKSTISILGIGSLVIAGSIYTLLKKEDDF